jgi:hypothetical protein
MTINLQHSYYYNATKNKTMQMYGYQNTETFEKHIHLLAHRNTIDYISYQEFTKEYNPQGWI